MRGNNHVVAWFLGGKEPTTSRRLAWFSDGARIALKKIRKQEICCGHLHLKPLSHILDEISGLLSVRKLLLSGQSAPEARGGTQAIVAKVPPSSPSRRARHDGGVSTKSHSGARSSRFCHDLGQSGGKTFKSKYFPTLFFSFSSSSSLFFSPSWQASKPRVKLLLLLLLLVSQKKGKEGDDNGGILIWTSST